MQGQSLAGAEGMGNSLVHSCLCVKMEAAIFVGEGMLPDCPQVMGEILSFALCECFDQMGPARIIGLKYAGSDFVQASFS